MSSNLSEIQTIAQRYGLELPFDHMQNSNNLSLKQMKDLNSVEFHNTDNDEDRDHSFCYLCSLNQHEPILPRDESKRRKLIPYNNPRARLSESLKRTEKESSPSYSLVSYQIIVRTGTQIDSGTRAQVYLYMYGTDYNWKSIPLQKSHSSNSAKHVTDGFPTGSTRTFCLKGPDIGQLHRLNVNLVGTRSEKEWFLKEIEITNLNSSRTWLCEFNCWFSKNDMGNTKQMQTIKYSHKDFSLTTYILQIRTGEKSFANKNTNIKIIVDGSLCQTQPLIITNKQNNLFEQDQLDTFAIVGDDLGDLLELSIELDKTQISSEWDIKDIVMWKILPHHSINANEKSSHVYFPCNTRLSKKQNKLKIKHEMYSKIDQDFKGPICYELIVKTGNVMNAGTDANVFLIIFGKNARTSIHQLNNRMKNDFERNATSEFMIMDIDVGQIDRIKIWHDDSNVGSAWFLDSIVLVKKYSTCYNISNVYIQRIKQLSQIFHNEINDKFKINNPSISSPERNSLTSNDNLKLNRSILRSPTVSDKLNLNKRVTWDEQSLGSYDDLLSNDSKSIKTTVKLNENNHHNRYDSICHQIYWISSHNYVDKKWKIKSIEENKSFSLDETILSFLLSDRFQNPNKIKATSLENNDEIYEFHANRWLAKNEDDGQIEIFLTPKKIYKRSTQISKPVNAHQSKNDSLSHPTKSLNPISNRSNLLKNLTNESNYTVQSTTDSHSSFNNKLSSARYMNDSNDLSNTQKQSIVLKSGQRKSIIPNYNNDLSTTTSHPKDTLHSSELLNVPLSLSDRLVNSRQTSTKHLLQPTNQSRSPTPSKPLYNLNDFSSQLANDRELLTRILTESQSSISQSAYNTNYSINSSLNTEDKLSRTSVAPINQSRSKTLMASTQFSKPLQSYKESTNSLERAAVRPSANTKLIAHSYRSMPPQKSIYDQRYNSTNDTVASSDDF